MQELEPEFPASPLRTWLVRALAAAGLALAYYLTWASVTESTPAGCGGGVFDCDAVLASRWSKWFGLPVAFPAISLYAMLLVASLFMGPRSPLTLRKLSWGLATLLAAAAAGAGLWFIGLQVFVLREYCLYCLAEHFCGLLLLAILISAGQFSFARRAAIGGAGLACSAALAVSQLLSPIPETHVVQVVDPQSSSGETLVIGVETPSAENPASTNEPPQAADSEFSFDDLIASGGNENTSPRQTPAGEVVVRRPAFSADDSGGEGSQPANYKRLSILGGQAVVEIGSQPVLGALDAEHVVVKLFDYTCPHCRELHEKLALARRRYGETFAVAMLPMPMNTDCNAYITRTHAKHVDACKLARLGLAVWRIDPQAYLEFDAFLFTGKYAPSAASAREKAEELVSAERLLAELDRPQINQQIHQNVELYRLCKGGIIPKLLFEKVAVNGDMSHENHLFRILERELQLKPLTSDP